MALAQNLIKTPQLPKMKLAEEELLQKYEQDQIEVEIENNAARLEEITSAEVKYGKNIEKSMKKSSKKATKNSALEEQAQMKKVMDEEMALDLHRMYMEREDQRSREANDMWHR